MDGMLKNKKNLPKGVSFWKYLDEKRELLDFFNTHFTGPKPFWKEDEEASTTAEHAPISPSFGFVAISVTTTPRSSPASVFGKDHRHRVTVVPAELKLDQLLEYM